MQKAISWFFMLFGSLLLADNKGFEAVAEYYQLDKNAYLKLFNSQSINQQKMKEFSVITIPKSGTHMLGKFLSMITGRLSHDHAGNRPDQFMLIHFDYEKQKKFAFSRREAVKFLNVRNPRDIAVSAVFWFWDTPNPALRGGEWVPIDQGVYGAWRRLDFDGKLSMLFETETYPFGYIKQNFREAMKLSSRVDTFVNRYEDLVGEKGGGSKEVQKKIMLQIARVLNLPPLTREQLAFLQENLYGYSPTFQEGRIGKRRDLFKSYHELLLQRNLFTELAYFGY